MRERGLEVDHSTVFRWVQRYAPELNKRIRQHLKMSGTSYQVDETYIKVGKTCKYLYRAVDKEGNTISVDKNTAYPEAFSNSQDERIVPTDCKLRRVKYLNNVIEQDRRFIKKKVRAAQCFKSFHTSERALEGIEAMNMIRKGQVKDQRWKLARDCFARQTYCPRLQT